MALSLSFLESLIPQIPMLPPGARLGLANIAVMFTCLCVGLPQGFAVTLAKSLFVLLIRGASSFFMSISGGLLSICILTFMLLIQKKLKNQFSYIIISVSCAVFHNIGQLIAAGIYTKTNLAKGYLPFLIVFGIISGTITGIILKTVMPVLTKRIVSIKNYSNIGGKKK